MTIESMLAVTGYTIAVFSFGYMIGKDLNTRK
ncbi:hypothetical protein SAMN04487861_11068 [Selenomonas ruminantium]|jgi:hypothetical protein|uniref:Uncharacterized protein n=1 Tax=Selenomonas ruminantium TaxID=971 RepID=A0A1I3EIP2_SELRU|nr:hypothetical protein SAMN04487861_11068 [Selenomonas ruminantium]